MTQPAAADPSPAERVTAGDQAALAGIRVCDLSGQLAGAGATRYLAAFGAEVVRVEDPVTRGGWDIVRGAPPFVDQRRGIELGGCFNNYNVGKLGVTLNLRTDRGRQLLSGLIRHCDVVTENFAAGVFARMGFPYDVLRELRPDVIYVSNCGFGHTGPYAAFRTWGPIVQACSGLAFDSALPGLEPAGWGYSYMDHMGANYMAMAVLAAVLHRQRTGEGQWVDMSCTEAAMTLTGTDILAHTANGRPPRAPRTVHSNRSPTGAMAPHGIYPALGDDEWIAIACRSDEDWARLRAEAGEGWATDRRFATVAGRLAEEDELDILVGRWTACHDRHLLADRLAAAGVPAAAVLEPAERTGDPDLNRWGMWPTVDHPEMGRVPVDGIPVHLADTDWVVEEPAPCLGQHNRRVLGGWLGVGDDELDELARQGVI